MIPADLNTLGAALVSWLLTYAIHSTILLLAAAVIAWRFSDQHAWLDLVWKAALIGPLVSATLQPGIAVAPLGGPWSIADAPFVAAQTGMPASPAPVQFEPAPIVDRSASSVSRRVEPGAEVVSTGTAPTISRRRRRSDPPPVVAGANRVVMAGRCRHRRRELPGAPASRVSDFSAATPVNADVLERADGLRDAARPMIAVGVSDSCQVPLALAGRRIVVPGRLFQTRSGTAACRAGTRDGARLTARSRMAHCDRPHHSRVLFSALVSTRPRAAARLGRISVRPVGGAADAITAGAGALPLRSGRVVRGRSCCWPV